MDLRTIDKTIEKCNKCGDMVEKFPCIATVFQGKNNDVVIVGEAPANNGWRKSHMLWRNEEGKMLPSGVVLQRLFDFLDKDILETTFLEAVKCYPKERKNLKPCLDNCKEILQKQLQILKPKYIITLGEYPTRIVLGKKFKRLSEVVGNIYEIDGFKIVPIFHPSPISPLSYKGNISVFEQLRKELNKEVYE